MNALEVLIPVSLFVCIAYSIKAVVDARTRARLFAVHRPDDLMRMIVLTEERQRRHSTLRWGIVLCCLAAGFGLVQIIGWREITPGGVAVLLGATGAGNIISYLVARALDKHQPSPSSALDPRSDT